MIHLGQIYIVQRVFKHRTDRTDRLYLDRANVKDPKPFIEHAYQSEFFELDVPQSKRKLPKWW